MQWWVLNQLLAAAVALALRATFNQNPHLCVDRALVNIKVVLTRNHRSHCAVLHPRFMISEQTARHWARDARARCDSTPAGERVTSPPHPALTTRRAGPLTSSCDWVLMVVSRRSAASLSVVKKKSSVGSFRRQNCFRLAASLKLRETPGSCLLRVTEKPSVRCVLHKKARFWQPNADKGPEVVRVFWQIRSFFARFSTASALQWVRGAVYSALPPVGGQRR